MKVLIVLTVLAVIALVHCHPSPDTLNNVEENLQNADSNFGVDATKDGDLTRNTRQFCCGGYGGFRRPYGGYGGFRRPYYGGYGGFPGGGYGGFPGGGFGGGFAGAQASASASSFGGGFGNGFGK